MPKIQLTEKEKDLIEMIRLLRKAYPNGYETLLDYCQRLFDDLVDVYSQE